jgi:tetratricopeptide (TPR) repeat protein
MKSEHFTWQKRRLARLKFTMKKSTFVLSATLCMGLAQTGTTPLALAQPAPLRFSQVRVAVKQDIEGKKYEDAEKDALQMVALAESPDETNEALTVLGQTYYLRKMYEPARVQWNKLLALNPDGNYLYHLFLARSFSAEGNFVKSIPHYEVALLELDKENAKDQAEKPEKDASETLGLGTLLSLGLANAYYHTEQYDLAQEQLKRVVKSSQGLDFLNLIALTRSSEINYAELSLEKAIEGFKKVLASEEDAPALKKYAQLQIDRASTWLRNNGDGKHGVNMKMNLENSTEDVKMNLVIQTLIDALVDGSIVGALGE